MCDDQQWMLSSVAQDWCNLGGWIWLRLFPGGLHQGGGDLGVRPIALAHWPCLSWPFFVDFLLGLWQPSLLAFSFGVVFQIWPQSTSLLDPLPPLACRLTCMSLGPNPSGTAILTEAIRVACMKVCCCCSRRCLGALWGPRGSSP